MIAFFVFCFFQMSQQVINAQKWAVNRLQTRKTVPPPNGKPTTRTCWRPWVECTFPRADASCATTLHIVFMSVTFGCGHLHLAHHILPSGRNNAVWNSIICCLGRFSSVIQGGWKGSCLGMAPPLSNSGKWHSPPLLSHQNLPAYCKYRLITLVEKPP